MFWNTPATPSDCGGEGERPCTLFGNFHTSMGELVVLFGLIAFTERMKSEVTVSAIRISLENIHDNHYLEEKDIMKLMRLDLDNLRGAGLSTLNFREIEQRIRAQLMPSPDEPENGRVVEDLQTVDV